MASGEVFQVFTVYSASKGQPDCMHSNDLQYRHEIPAPVDRAYASAWLKETPNE